MSTSLTTFTTTHRVINGVHNNAAVARTTTQMTATTSLTTNLKVVLRIADNTDGGTTSLKNHAHLATRHLDDSILVVTRHQLSISTGRTDHLGTLARTKLDIVYQRTERNLGQQQRIADFRNSTGTRHNSLTNFQTLRAKYIALLTVGIANKCNTRTTVGVVLDSLHDGGNTILIALEVDKTIQFLVATANVAHGHLTLIVATTTLADTVDKTFFRLSSGNIVIGDNELVTLAGSCGFNSF